MPVIESLHVYGSIEQNFYPLNPLSRLTEVAPCRQFFYRQNVESLARFAVLGCLSCSLIIATCNGFKQFWYKVVSEAFLRSQKDLALTPLPRFLSGSPENFVRQERDLCLEIVVSLGRACFTNGLVDDIADCQCPAPLGTAR